MASVDEDYRAQIERPLRLAVARFLRHMVAKRLDPIETACDLEIGEFSAAEFLTDLMFEECLRAGWGGAIGPRGLQ